MYVHDIEVGTTALEGKPEIVKETAATALVEGNNLLGPVSVICLQGGSGHLWGVVSGFDKWKKSAIIYKTLLHLW